MDNVELNLAYQGSPELLGLAARGRHADENFAVLKRNYIGRPGLIEELPVQPRHPLIGDKQDSNFVGDTATIIRPSFLHASG